jgi:hypothetical protein
VLLDSTLLGIDGQERAGLERLLRNSARPFPWSDAHHYPKWGRA